MSDESGIPGLAPNIVFGQNQELSKELIVAQYNSLTTERNNRQNIRYQMMQFAVVALAALLTVSSAGIQNHLDFLIFTYPDLVLVLSIIYIANTFETRRIENYLKTRFEIFLPVIEGERMGWYGYRKGDRTEFLGSIGNIGAKIVFVGTAIFAILMGLQIMHQGDKISEMLLKVAVAVTIGLAILLLLEGIVYELLVLKKVPWVERPIRPDKSVANAALVKKEVTEIPLDNV